MSAHSTTGEHPTVSIVITCYNQARFLAEAIESALDQTYTHVEIVVVDDGSQDETPQVVGRYESVRYIRQKNQGVAYARNNGLRATAGRYVTFLDGDDRLLSEAVAVGVRNLDAHPECAFVFGRCRLINADGEALPTKHDSPVERNHYLELIRNNYIWMPAKVMYRREILEAEGGFDPTVDHAGDYSLYLNIARRHPLYDHKEIVAEWRQHSTNTSRNSTLMLRASLDVLRAQRPFLKGKEQHEAYESGRRRLRMFFGDPIVERVREHLRTPGGRGEAVKDALWLLRHCPQIVAEQIFRKVRHSVRGRGLAAGGSGRKEDG